MNFIQSVKKALILVLILFLVSCGSRTKEAADHTAGIHEIDFTGAEELPFDVHAHAYLVVRLNDFKVLYRMNDTEEIYPASLTKILTMDTVLRNARDLEDTSSYSSAQYWELIDANASVAGLWSDTGYTLEELLYALVLPSGADAAKALENYFSDEGRDLVDLMNENAKRIGMDHSHFTNTTGLHDDDFYTTLDDLLKLILDALSYEKGREVLETLSYRSSRSGSYTSTVLPVDNSYVEVLGGKTGFTGQAGQNIIVLFRHEDRSYLLILSGAMGDPGRRQYYHYEDALNIFEYMGGGN